MIELMSEHVEFNDWLDHLENESFQALICTFTEVNILSMLTSALSELANTDSG